MTQRCANCGHTEPHNGPAGTVDDACTHPMCKCGYFVAMTPPDARQVAEQIAGGHYFCEDCWYSCPLSSDGCCDESQVGCTCGRDARVERITRALSEARRQVWEEQTELLHAIYTSVRGDEKGECWTIRAYLDKHGIFHDDIQNETRLIEEACKHALRQRALPSEQTEAPRP